MNNNQTLRSLTLGLLATTTALTLAQPRYRVYDLGAVNGTSEAFAINDQNEAVGWSFLNNGTRGAVKFANGQITVLSATGGTSVALAINDDGMIVGKRGTRAVKFLGNNMATDLGTLGGQESVAYGLNDRGDVAGSAQRLNANWRALGIVQRRSIDLGTLGGAWASAQDVNNVGVFVGWSHTTGPTRAAMFVAGKQPETLGTLGGPQSVANSISDYFHVTGWSDLRTRHNTPTNRGYVRRAFMWYPNEGLRNLGDPYTRTARFLRDSLGRSYFQQTIQLGEGRRLLNVYGIDTFGTGVNESGTVVGYARLFTNVAPGQVDRATVTLRGLMYDLNSLIGTQSTEWQLQYAWGTNRAGVIVGRGINYRTGTVRAFIAVRTN